MKISFYPGCSLEGMANDYARSIQSVFKELGIDLVEIEDWTGCGATAAVAQVNGDKCTACLACVRVCPFSAPFINEEGVSCIPPSACMGCGICAAECPAKAISLKHCTDDQVVAKIDALLESAFDISTS